MAEQFSSSSSSADRLREDIETILRQVEGALPPEDRTATDTTTAPAPESSEAASVIHVFVVDDLPPLAADPQREADTVESTLAAQESRTPSLVSFPPAAHSRTWHWRRWAGLACALLLLLLLIGASALHDWTPPTATVTLLPMSSSVTTTTTIAVTAEGPSSVPTSTMPQIPGRLLASITLTQMRTVPTTGIGTQAAQAAEGTITFYNAAPYAQSIAAGTLLTGADGVAVVTTQTAFLPAAILSTPPQDGQATVPAHAVSDGPTGNIAAHDINGLCCLTDIVAQNVLSFHGGQRARTYPMVTPKDITTAVDALTASLVRSVQAAFASQVLPPEMLVTPVACTPHVSSTHAAGEEATQVTVTLSETCAGATYNTQALHALLVRSLAQKAEQEVGKGYHEAGDIQTHITQVQPLHMLQGIVTIKVQASGVWVYQFSQRQLDHLAHAIAGKTVTEATTRLLQTPGVQTVSLHVGGQDNSTLPTDPGAIHFLVVYMGQ